MQGHNKLWHDVYYYCDDDEIIEWYEDHKKCKAQKAKKKTSLCPLLGIHQDGRIGVRQKTRKKRQKNSGGGLFDMLRLKMY